MRKYYNYSVKKAVTVKNLTTIESLEVESGFSYPEEAHDFYELVYIDRGRLGCRERKGSVILSEGELFIIKPNTAHSYFSVDEAPSAFFIFCFHSTSAALNLINEKICLQTEDKRVFFEMVSEAKCAFAFPFNKKLKPLPSPTFAAQEMVIIKMEQLLVLLLRRALKQSSFIKPVMNSSELETNLASDIIALLRQSVYSRITLDGICAQLFYSKTYLNAIFKKSTGATIMHYYHGLKVEEAKRLLREKVSISEISSRLCFESASYFIKFFKHRVGLTPSAWYSANIGQ